ncbi:uncharacterized protein DS421_17g575560 [Arachis hypogaea]|nr:uncharacterized protein DS421_17g575560 [Arachis hypogaea]
MKRYLKNMVLIKIFKEKENINLEKENTIQTGEKRGILEKEITIKTKDKKVIIARIKKKIVSVDIAKKKDTMQMNVRKRRIKRILLNK